MSADAVPRSPNVSAALAKIFVGLSCATQLMFSVYRVYLDSLPDTPFGERYAAIEKYRVITLLAGPASTYILIAAMAAHLLWVGRAVAFARRTGADVTAPLRAVGVYFAPLIQFVYPYRHMQALVRSTAPERDVDAAGERLVEQPYRTSARRRELPRPRRSVLVVAWWSAWLLWIGSWAALVLLRGSLRPSLTLFHVLEGCSYACAAGLITGLGLGVGLVFRVSRVQRATAAHLAARKRASEEMLLEVEVEPPLPPIRRPPPDRPESVFIELERELAAKRRARRRARKAPSSTGASSHRTSSP